MRAKILVEEIPEDERSEHIFESYRWKAANLQSKGRQTGSMVQFAG